MSKQTLFIIIVTAVVGVIIARIFNGQGVFTGLTNQRGVQGAQGTGLYGTTTGVAETPYG